MIHIAIISGDVAICHGLEKILSDRHLTLSTEEGITNINDIHPSSLRADFILLDVQLLRHIPLLQWQEHITHGKIIILSTFADERKSLTLLQRGVSGLFTKSIDQKRWATVIYHPSEKQTPLEQEFMTQWIPRILQWEATSIAQENIHTIALEAEIIHLLDAGKTLSDIEEILQIDRSIIQKFVSIIDEVRSA